jgi:hypothetical protein
MAEGYVANGAKVYITGRRLDVLQSTAAEINRDFAEMAGSGEVVALQGDVSTKASVQLLAEDLARRETKVGCDAPSFVFRGQRRPSASGQADDDGDPSSLTCWSTTPAHRDRGRTLLPSTMTVRPHPDPSGYISADHDPRS